MSSVSQLGRRFGLSRSTLLYYDRIGLLSPSARSPAGYRVYGDADVKRLEAICRYRKGGLGLRAIAELLDGASTAKILSDRLAALDAEIERLREQQRVVVKLLAQRGVKDVRAMDKERWTAILRSAGLDDAQMRRWHEEFERRAPRGHQDFLESLGLSKGEVARIRKGMPSRA